MSVTGTIRFLVGAGLVAAGIPLVSPLALKLAAVAGSAPVVPSQGGGGAGVGGGPTMQAAPFPPPAAMVAQPPAVTEVAPPFPGDAPVPDAWAGPHAPGLPDSGGGLQLDRSPPPPPAPLPPVPGELSRRIPNLGAAYRSTLRVPPPDLLDAEAPPPVGPHAAVPSPGRHSATPTVSPAPASADLTVPTTYRVRDGDDLGTIAGRFYGHPAAASAIWAANRETIQHPDLLPIGAEIRLPPPWAIVSRQSVTGSIEPAAYARPVAASSQSPAEMPTAARASWLPPSPSVTVEPLPVSLQTVPASPPAAAFVRVGPGETLPSLARRLYGDPAMAEQIFAANRDRLRSPDLVVTGMELRLPRPTPFTRP